MSRISGKLTAKSLGWDRASLATATKNVPASTGRVFMGRIVGIVSGLHTTVNDDDGSIQTGLKGNFKGVSSLNEFVAEMKDGKAVRDAKDQPIMVDTGKAIEMTAGRCYLPGGIQDMIEGAYSQAVATDPKATVQFGIDLYGIPATNRAGYSFDADTILDAGAVDPLDALLSTAAKTEALPAPTVLSEQVVEPPVEDTPIEAAAKAPHKHK